MLAAALGKYRRVTIDQYRGWPSRLPDFEKEVAALKPNERICLNGTFGVNELMSILTHPKAAMVASLVWEHEKKDDPSLVIPLLGHLVMLEVVFEHYDEIEFLARALEYHTYIKAIVMPHDMPDGCAEFFHAVGTVEMLSINPTAPGLARYLAKNDLQMLELAPNVTSYMPNDVLDALKNCTNLTTLNMHDVEFGGGAVLSLPESVTTLVLCDCLFLCWTGGTDLGWSIPGVTTLFLQNTSTFKRGDFGPALSRVLASRRPLDALHLNYVTSGWSPNGLHFGAPQPKCMPLGAMDPDELAKIRKLSLTGMWTNEDLWMLTSALVQADSKVRDLKVTHLPKPALATLEVALRHSCVDLISIGWGDDRTLWVEWRHRKQVAVFALLLARRRGKPMYRLPIELYRMVAKMLL